MNRREFVAGIGAAALVTGPVAAASAGAARYEPKRKILMFTKSAGYEHSAIHREGGKLGFAEKTLTDLGSQSDIEITCTKDGTIFTPENIAKYDAFFFYTTGDLTTVGTDGNPAMTAAGKAALLEAISKGKGFLGTHSATDSFHTPPDAPDSVNRYTSHGEKVDPYIKMIGGEFIKHGPQQVAKMKLVDDDFPGCPVLGGDFDLMDEWYSLKDFQPNLHVILVQETAGMKGAEYKRAPYPATWARMHGKGRVFYTNMGHREDVWISPIFQSIIVGGMNWATGNVSADVKPNLNKACPGHMELPPRVV
jgi:type 1 glutamine amidotransferase